MATVARYLPADAIAKAAYDAGFRGEALKTAIAVVYAESGGNELSVNKNANGSEDWGLFQINSIHKDQITKAQALTALANAKYAFKLSKSGTYWKPWVGYTNGNYKQYLPKAAIVAADVDKS